jgi:hypothetical protein
VPPNFVTLMQTRLSTQTSGTQHASSITSGGHKYSA